MYIDILKRCHKVFVGTGALGTITFARIYMCSFRKVSYIREGIDKL